MLKVEKCQWIKFGNIRPDEVLKDLSDGEPLLFTFYNKKGQYFLAYLFDITEETRFYLVFPTSHDLVEAAKQNFIPIRDVMLSQAWIFYVQQNSKSGEWTKPYSVERGTLEEEMLPPPGVYLNTPVEVSVAGDANPTIDMSTATPEEKKNFMEQVKNMLEKDASKKPLVLDNLYGIEDSQTEGKALKVKILGQHIGDAESWAPTIGWTIILDGMVLTEVGESFFQDVIEKKKMNLGQDSTITIDFYNGLVNLYQVNGKNVDLVSKKFINFDQMIELEGKSTKAPITEQQATE